MEATFKKFVSLFFLAFLAGCQTTNVIPVGPTVGANDAGVSATGALLEPLDGGLVARALGKEAPRADRTLALQNEYRALEYTAPGEAVLWQGDRLKGRIVPSQPYRVGSQDCRQYEHTVNDRTAETTVRGTACRNDDGSWSLLS